MNPSLVSSPGLSADPEIRSRRKNARRGRQKPDHEGSKGGDYERRAREPSAGESMILPVVNDGELLGIVSIGDLVKSIISDRDFVVEQLEHYIRR